MTMTGAGHRMTAVEVEITQTVAGKNPDAFATRGDDRHFFVSRELISLFEFRDIAQSGNHNFSPRRTQTKTFDNSKQPTFCLTHLLFFSVSSVVDYSYGFVPTSINPVFSSKPNIRFMFCTA